MSAEIINLRQVRKQRAREQRAADAAENRARSGRTKAERDVEAHARTRADQVLDGHILGTPESTGTADRVDDQDGEASRSVPKPQQ